MHIYPDGRRFFVVVGCKKKHCWLYCTTTLYCTMFVFHNHVQYFILFVLQNPVECKIALNWKLFSPERSHNVVRVLLQPLNSDNFYNKHDGHRFRDCGWGKEFKGRECFKPNNFFRTIPRASTARPISTKLCTKRWMCEFMWQFQLRFIFIFHQIFTRQGVIN